MNSIFLFAILALSQHTVFAAELNVKPDAALSPLLEIKELKGAEDNGNFDFIYPQLSKNFKGEAIRKKVNAQIMKQLKYAKWNLKNANSDEFHTQQYVKSTLNLEMISPEALSYTINFERSGYAMIDSNPILFDLTTGDPVKLEKEILPAKQKEFHQMLSETFVKRSAKESSGANCSFVPATKDTPASLGGGYFDYTLVKDGVAVRLNYPQAMAACGFSITLPFSEFKNYVAPNSMLGKLASSSK